MRDLAIQAAKIIESYRNNEAVMSFVKREALQKTAKEMNDNGYSCTAMAVELLMTRHKNIADRVSDYVDLGLIGCYMESLSINK